MATESLVDAKGLKCPMPVIQLQRQVRQSESGDLVMIEYTDKNAFKDIRSWCNINGHTLLDEEPREISPANATQQVLAVLIQVK